MNNSCDKSYNFSVLKLTFSQGIAFVQKLLCTLLTVNFLLLFLFFNKKTFMDGAGVRIWISLKAFHPNKGKQNKQLAVNI